MKLERPLGIRALQTRSRQRRLGDPAPQPAFAGQGVFDRVRVADADQPSVVGVVLVVGEERMRPAAGDAWIRDGVRAEDVAGRLPQPGQIAVVRTRA